MAIFLAVVTSIFHPYCLRLGIEMEIIDQCVVNNGGCDHYCQTTLTGDLPGIGVICSCHHGYRLHQDGHACIGGLFAVLAHILCSLYVYILFIHLFIYNVRTAPCSMNKIKRNDYMKTETENHGNQMSSIYNN